jgi:hypothetical protein
MKKELLSVTFLLAGALIGYYVASVDRLIGWNFFWEIFSGSIVGLVCSMAFIQKQYGILVAAIVGLAAFVSFDLLAGSSIVLKGKLGQTLICAIIGWYFPVYLKQMLVGGGIGAVCGFAWGLLHSHKIGEVCMAPGLYGAVLLSTIGVILGMSIGKLYMMSFGWRFMQKSNQN